MRVNDPENHTDKVETAAPAPRGFTSQAPQGRFLTAGRAAPPPSFGASTQQSSPVVYCEKRGQDTYWIVDGRLEYEAPFHIMFALREQCRKKGVRFVRVRTKQ